MAKITAVPAAALALVLLAAPAAFAAFTVTVVPASSWGAPDAELGLDGAVVEDFEDLDLAPGLLVELGTIQDTFAGDLLDALPATFDPAVDDLYGDAFVIGVWDGVNVFFNTPGNATVDYGFTEFRRVQLHVPGGTAWFGLSLQQLTGNEGLIVNGRSLGRVAGLGLAPTSGRNGYLIVSSDDPAEPILSVAVGGGGDAFVIDHVAFASPGQVPIETAGWSAVKALYR